MSGLTSAWLAAARLRRRLARRRAAEPPREELVRRHAPGKSFADVGCMWKVDGAVAYLAEECGARTVTGVDVMEPTPGFLSEHARRSSRVRFVLGDLHDPSTVEEVGGQDVVWCWGLLYHAPNPVLTLERLRSLTRELLILGTETIPEVPGLRQACVFYPGLPWGARRAFAARSSEPRLGITTGFDPAAGYGNWWWGMTGSAVRSMLEATGFEVIEAVGGPFHMRLLARPA